MNKEHYSKLHTLEWDILNSECKDCYIDGLECSRYTSVCRKENQR